MRLSHIKLAGFKSFVDPAHIPVPGGLVGVVGPNGCGKSNVIDAVRWVLGESSAKHLRGETMQDVIFNGSGERKPANRASVELVFDNSLGKAGGPWASYVEISVKRVLERDGESAYFINNQHVRRRDVADIFLGTGLGGRAYAIIEQGMISRVVDARPEELRTFLEEAASISRYRERRKETEQRLEDTRENLARVDDILLELDQRLEHLERQAEVARRYRALEDQLRSAQQLLWLLRKQEATNQRQRVSRELEQLAVDLEADTARLRALESEIAHLRTAHFASSDLMHAAQGAMYESNAGVARLEQSLQHQRESRSRVEAQKASLVREREEAARQADIARGNLGDQTSNLAQAAERLKALHAQEHMLKADLPAAESEFAATRAELDRLSQELVRSQQEQQVERMRQDHAQRLLGQLAQRRERLSQEETALLDVDAAELERLGLDLAELDTRQRDQRTALEVAEAAAATYELGHRQQVEEADVVARDLASLEARLSALQLLQRQVSRSGEMHAWLDNHELDALGRLWQGIRIEPGWEDALEAVLRERLNAIALADLHTAAAWIEGPPPGKISFFVREQSLPQPPAAPFTPLAQYVTCRDAGLTAVLVDWLSEVYVAAEALEGFARRGELPEGAVLVCPEGHLFTRHSVSFHAADSEIHGILSRQREIDSLQLQQGDLADRVTRTRDAANSARVQLEAQREEVQRLRKRAEEVQQARHDLQLDQVRLSQQGERVAHRRAQIADEAAELAAEVQREEQVRHAAGARLTTLDGLLTDLGQRVAEAQVSHQGAGERLSQRRDELQAALRRSQESEFGHREIVNNINNLTHILQELDEKEGHLAAQLETLGLELAQLDEASLRAELDAALEVRAAREQALVRARSGLEEAERGLKEAEQQRMLCEQRLAPLRDRMGELRLKEQETRLSEEGFAAQLAEAGADEGALAERLEKGTRPGSLQADIHRYTEEMTSLGAVNLAALDELSTAQERKAYLEAQSADLHEAVATLETAIRRIDRETRERLQTTFDEVNRNLTELFPLLFGGGEARLVMSGEEILDAGVSIVARPPGKRNASIHLLSGGEKALTALALVFSLFQLNPAPFCLLDEVDAPLDDSNTERFCALVKKMAAQTQFVFISHNKITMELAEQLVGVTMAEQGVSKVVAVDIEEALKFREEAAA